MTHLNRILQRGLFMVGLLFLSGQKAETAFRAAFCQSQIGEFCFVIAALGGSLEVVDQHFVSITFGGAIGTILLLSMLNRRATQIFLGTVYHNSLGSVDNP